MCCNVTFVHVLCVRCAAGTSERSGHRQSLLSSVGHSPSCPSTASQQEQKSRAARWAQSVAVRGFLGRLPPQGTLFGAAGASRTFIFCTFGKY